MISLMAETERMKMRGTRVVYLPVGDTSGICCSNAIIKKNILAHLRNCSKRNRGMNLITLKKKNKNDLKIIRVSFPNSPIFGRWNPIITVLDYRGLSPIDKDHAMLLPLQGVSARLCLSIDSRRSCTILLVYKKIICNKINAFSYIFNVIQNILSTLVKNEISVNDLIVFPKNAADDLTTLLAKTAASQVSWWKHYFLSVYTILHRANSAYFLVLLFSIF